MQINSGGIDTANVICDTLMAIMHIACGTDMWRAPATAGCWAKKRECIAVDADLRW